MLISSAIAAAIEEQASATQQVVENISGVSQASKETGNIVSGVTEASNLLSTEAVTLKTRVDEFLVQVRAI